MAETELRYTVNGGGDVDLRLIEIFEPYHEFKVTGYAHGVENFRKLVDELDAQCKIRERAEQNERISVD